MKTLSVFCTPLSFLHRGLLILGLCLLPSVSMAQNEGRWYQVEVLIFKRLGLNNTEGELWRENPKLSYPQNTQYLPKTLPRQVHQLGGHNYALRKDENYQVLFHKAWTQQMWGSKRSPSLIIRGGQQFGDHQELEGTLKIHIGRYLHVTTDLWLSEFAIEPEANSQYRLPLLPGQASSEFFVEKVQPSRVVTFREHRRMRSKETHYIDHPLMGILVRMLPIKGK